ncbi:hypothetical protein [Faecalimicrobium dakarense]|uniref:hypothetical protein n=1 Tax=Faecalimicrobium dakarense TaxID=1301100 RepID=UPI0004BB037F|nr:hypothetical protein [[Clostridium] dakarense]
MKSKTNNTIEFKPKDSSGYDSNRKYPLNNKNLGNSAKVIPYSKRKKKSKLKSLKINKQVDKFEGLHPFLKKYKPIIILFIIILFISFISFINKNVLNNSYGHDDEYYSKNFIVGTTKLDYQLTYKT